MVEAAPDTLGLFCWDSVQAAVDFVNSILYSRVGMKLLEVQVKESDIKHQGYFMIWKGAAEEDLNYDGKTVQAPEGTLGLLCFEYLEDAENFLHNHLVIFRRDFFDYKVIKVVCREEDFLGRVENVCVHQGESYLDRFYKEVAEWAPAPHPRLYPAPCGTVAVRQLRVLGEVTLQTKIVFDREE